MKNETACITVSCMAEVQSDLNPQDPLQKAVRFSPDLSLLLTGGTDGHIRVWEVGLFIPATCSVSLAYLLIRRMIH